MTHAAYKDATLPICFCSGKCANGETIEFWLAITNRYERLGESMFTSPREGETSEQLYRRAFGALLARLISDNPMALAAITNAQEAS